MSQIYFWNKTVHVSDSSSVQHQEFFTVHTAMVCVQWKAPDAGQKNSPKHVQFYSKNKFETLVHPVGFIIRIYHNARSPEHQISYWSDRETFLLQDGARSHTANNSTVAICNIIQYWIVFCGLFIHTIQHDETTICQEVRKKLLKQSTQRGRP